MGWIPEHLTADGAYITRVACDDIARFDYPVHSAMVQGVRKRGPGRFRGHSCRRKTRWGREWGRDERAVQGTGEVSPAEPSPCLRMQIGRASCRERV